MMRLFLTGGHGFIGSRVTRRLVERGDEVTLLLREHSKTHRVDDLKWARAMGDIRDRAALERAMAGHEACIHLACISSWSELRSQALESVVLDGTRNVLEAAKATGIRRVVIVSSAAAVGGSKTPQVFNEESPFPLEGSGLRYAEAKHRAERLALSFNKEAGSELEVLFVNPAEVYGPNDDALITAGTLRDLLNSWPVMICSGGTSVVHVDDVAAGIVAALDRGRPGERYILGGENLTVAQLTQVVLGCAGQNKPVIVLPNWLLAGLIRSLAALRLPTPLEPEIVPYATRYWFVSSDKAKRELGFVAREPSKTIGSVVAWLIERGLVKTPRRALPQ